VSALLEGVAGGCAGPACVLHEFDLYICCFWDDCDLGKSMFDEGRGVYERGMCRPVPVNYYLVQLHDLHTCRMGGFHAVYDQTAKR
jgi:hypothetical protein